MDWRRASGARDPGRLVGVDVARCVALVGMMSTHMLTDIRGGQLTWHQQLAGGRAAALFAVLAGVSLALVTGRTTPAQGRERLALSAGIAVRALIIAAIGLVLGGVGANVAVILVYYAALFLLGLPFLGLPSRTLAVLAVVWVVFVPVLAHGIRPLLPARGTASPHWESLQAPGQLFSELAFTGYYPAVPWLAYLLAGLALGRARLDRVRTAAALLAGGAALAAASLVTSALLVSNASAQTALRSTLEPGRTVGSAELDLRLARGLHGSAPTGSWWWLGVSAPHTATPFDLAQTTGSALAVIGLCLLVVRAAPRLFAVAFGAGAMTLTLYSAHVFALSPERWPHLEGPDHFPDQVVLVLVIGAAFALLGWRGPLEWLVREVSRGTARALRH